MDTATRRVVGRPFQKGDPRINRGGRPKAILTHALMATMSEDDAAKILKGVVALAKNGDLQAVQMLWDRLEGKPIGRNENGDPGAFDADLSDVETKTLKAALKRVK